MVEEIDVDSLFEEGESKISNTKEELFSIIEERSLNGEGVSFQQLKINLNIPEGDLKNLLRELEMESKIYQSEDNIYQTY